MCVVRIDAGHGYVKDPGPAAARILKFGRRLDDGVRGRSVPARGVDRRVPQQRAHRGWHTAGG